MTEAQAFEELAKVLPLDALIFVDRWGHKWRSLDGSETGWERWEVRIKHEPSGYLYRHAAKGRTAREAVDAALAKWRRYQRQCERQGVPRWVRVRGRPDPVDYRVGVPADRLFFDAGGGAREYAYIVRTAERRIDIAGRVPPHKRRQVLLYAVASAEGAVAREAA